MKNILQYLLSCISILSLLFNQKNILQSSAIEGITNPQQIIWKNENEIIVVRDEDILLYNLSSKRLEDIGKRQGNQFVGLDSKGDILLCTFEHFLIDSPEQFSTKFTVLEKEYFFFPTIRPIALNEKKIIAKTALDFLEQHYYSINLEDGEIKEIVLKKKKNSVKHSKDVILKDAYFLNEERYIVEDVFGNLYAYEKKKLNVNITSLILNGKWKIKW